MDQRSRNTAGSKAPSVAIIGAGMSGLAAGNRLVDDGVEVQVFEKSRGPGGRMATRRSEGHAFDHGAQYFTAGDNRFLGRVSEWVDIGVAAAWNARIGVFENGGLTPAESATQRYVGAPRMSSITRHLSAKLNIAYNTRIASVTNSVSGQWTLKDAANHILGDFDIVLSSVPPFQARQLVESNIVDHEIFSVKMLPSWAVMVVLDQPVAIDLDGIFVNEGPISWLARNNSKPGRSDEESWVIHSTPDWAEDNLEAHASDVTDILLSGFDHVVGDTTTIRSFISTHRWRYAVADAPENQGCFWNADHTVGIIGDWTNGSRVEGAFISGLTAAEQIVASFSEHS